MAESARQAKPKVIDVHYHLTGEGWWPANLSASRDRQRSVLVHVTGEPSKRAVEESVLERYRTEMLDPNAEKLLKKMDQAGIDLTVMVANDFEIGLGQRALLPIEDQNRHIAAVAHKHPDRLIAFCVIDPRRPEAIDIYRRCLKEYGMKGVGEYHPDQGFRPNGPESYRLLERLQEWDVPLLTHTGFYLPPFRTNLVDPMLLDDVCVDFPRLRIIAAHSGRTLWWETVAHLCRIHPNLYGDMAGFQTVMRLDFPRFCYIIRSFIDIAGPDKLLFATDDPGQDVMGVPTREYIKTIRELPEKAAPGFKFTAEEIDAVLGGNAQTLLGL